MNAPEALPIDRYRGAFVELITKGAVVVTSPTGSGKSTQVPRWCEGRVLVVEPRRIACRALAQRVAELEKTRLGTRVGYNVRDEQCLSSDTQIVFATPGVVLRTFAEWDRYQTIVLDEFHERSLDGDLLLALLSKRYRGHLVVMSATLEGERVAAHLNGSLLRGEGRMFPVTVQYVGGNTLLPSTDGLDQRVRRALDLSQDQPGDVLVFLPGKSELSEIARALRGQPGLDVIELHGSLSLEEQQRAFAPAQSGRRKIVLATNVAETSLTIPGIGVVIDGGLVRQTRYFQGRGHLMLVPIALDSAEQRAGRAGRTMPGVCYRLWSPAAKLSAVTQPEVYRESLVPLLLAAAACGEAPESLPLLDRPKEHAIASARLELEALGALDAKGAMTPRGRELFDLPLDAPLGRLLVEARATGALEDAIDLVSALATGRPLFLPGKRPDDAYDDLRSGGCDVTANILAVRVGDPLVHGLHRVALQEARRIRARLRRAHSLPEQGDREMKVDRVRLAKTALAADPRCVYIARRRGRELCFSNGGTERDLARDSAVHGAEDLQAIAVLATRAFATDSGDAEVQVTCATPLSLAWLLEAGVGRDRLAGVSVERGRIVARVERVYARKVLIEREEVPTGSVAREAIRELFVRGSIFRDSLALAKARLAAWTLAARLRSSGYVFDEVGWEATGPAGEELGLWVESKLLAMGVESGDELALLSGIDLVPPALPESVSEQLDREFPRTVSVGDAVYEVDYDLIAQQATLRMVRGTRKEPPPAAYLPKFPGMRVCVEAGRSLWVVRERR